MNDDTRFLKVFFGFMFLILTMFMTFAYLMKARDGVRPAPPSVEKRLSDLEHKVKIMRIDIDGRK